MSSMMPCSTQETPSGTTEITETAYDHIPMVLGFPRVGRARPGRPWQVS
jgi:hypothetical protein